MIEYKISSLNNKNLTAKVIKLKKLTFLLNFNLSTNW